MRPATVGVAQPIRDNGPVDPDLELALAERTTLRGVIALVVMVLVLGVFAVALMVLTPNQQSAGLTVGAIVSVGQIIGILALFYAVRGVRRLRAPGTTLPDAVTHLDRLAQALRNLALTAPALIVLTAVGAVLIASSNGSDTSAIVIAAIAAGLTAIEEVAILLAVRTRLLRRRDRLIPLAKVA